MATDPARRPATPGELVERLRAGWAEALPTGVVTFCLSDIEGSIRDVELRSGGDGRGARAARRADRGLRGAAWRPVHQVDRRRRLHCLRVRLGDRARSRPRSRPRARCRPSGGRTTCTSPRASASTPARPSAEEPTTAGRQSASPRGSAVRPSGGQIILSSVTAQLVAGHLPEGLRAGRSRAASPARPRRTRADPRGQGRGHQSPASGDRVPLPRPLAVRARGPRLLLRARDSSSRSSSSGWPPAGCVAVVGASGSGKSSLLRAGVIAAVRAGEVHDVERASLITPGSSPGLGLADDRTQLVVVDQFEELFTLCDDAARRQAFIDALLAVPGPGRDRRAGRHVREARAPSRARPRGRRQPGPSRQR